MILKSEVVCFDTLLQVFDFKGDEEGPGDRRKSGRELG